MIIAIISIAAVGLMMLGGRIDLRRGGAVVFGCFIIFGARSIAGALTGLGSIAAVAPPVRTEEPPLAVPVILSQPYDPYAGASVPQAR